jgi:hypothetical protein
MSTFLVRYAPLPLALSLALAGCGSDTTDVNDSVRTDSAAAAQQGAAAQQEGPPSPPPLEEQPPSKSVPATSPVRGDVSQAQRERKGDYVRPDVCMAEEFQAAAGLVLGAPPNASTGGFLTDVAGETAWALEYAGAVTAKDPTTMGADDSFPAEARLLCWYNATIVTTDEDARQGASASDKYRHAIVSISVDSSGHAQPTTPIAIFRSPNRLPMVAAPVSDVRTALNNSSRRASADEVEP